MKLIIATHNDHKAIEIKDIFFNTPFEIVTLKELNDFEDIAETGSTFVENACIKAMGIAAKYQAIALADDSGLSVEALSGRPGIYSARYSGLGDQENNRKLLLELEGVTQRSAYFTSAIALAFPNGDVKVYEGIWPGTIGFIPKGSEGFGYDPIFIPQGLNKTAAELKAVEKHTISHRARALSKLKEDLDEIINHG